MYGHHSSTRRAGGRGCVRGRSHTREPSLARVHVHAYTRALPEDLCCLSSRTKGADVYGRTRNHLLWHRFPRVWRAFLPFGFNDSFATPGAVRLARRVAALILRNEENGERLADAFSANGRRNDAALFLRARKYDSTKLLEEPALFLFSWFVVLNFRDPLCRTQSCTLIYERE